MRFDVRFCEASVYQVWRRTHLWIRCGAIPRHLFQLQLGCMIMRLDSDICILLFWAIEAFIHYYLCSHIGECIRVTKMSGGKWHNDSYRLIPYQLMLFFWGFCSFQIVVLLPKLCRIFWKFWLLPVDASCRVLFVMGSSSKSSLFNIEKLDGTNFPF